MNDFKPPRKLRCDEIPEGPTPEQLRAAAEEDERYKAQVRREMAPLKVVFPYNWMTQK